MSKSVGSEAQNFFLSDFVEGKALRFSAVNSLGDNDKGIGFVMKSDSTYIFITNRHLIEIEDYYTKKKKLAREPYTRMEFFALKNNQYFQFSNTIRDSAREYFVGSVYKGRPTDLIAMSFGANKTTDLFSEIDFTAEPKLKVGNEIFVVSILETSGGIGIFTLFSKIASDPKKDYSSEFGVLPIVLLEKTSLPGMSGSPVFAWPDKTKKPQFVGVLSGNTNGQSFFWRRDIVLDLVDVLKKRIQTQ